MTRRPQRHLTLAEAREGAALAPSVLTDVRARERRAAVAAGALAAALAALVRQHGLDPQAFHDLLDAEPVRRLAS